jgi:hypothetical protein
MRRKALITLFAGIVLAAFPSMVLADSATLHWQANTESDLAGYRVYYGVQSRSYGPYIPTAKTVTSYTLNGLTPGKTYYFALTAVDTSGNESGYSREVSKTISETGSTSGSQTGSTSGSQTGSTSKTAGGGGQSTLSAASASGCDASHLYLCQSEVECKDAGGYISVAANGTSTCMLVEGAPTTQEKPVNLMTSTSLMQSAPVALADGAAADGTITPGEKMHLQFRVPGYASPVDIYAGIQFPGAGTQLTYFQDNTNLPFTAQFKALKMNFKGPLNKMVYPDFDACAAFGSAYNGDWSVYYLIIPAQGRTFETADALLSYITKNHVPHRYEWYRLELKCGSAQ